MEQWSSALAAMVILPAYYLSSPTYDQWSFSPIKRFLHSLNRILTPTSVLWHNMENMLSVMILNYHNK